MSVSTEVQRTLVKSPPELWSELGNVEGLARHLGEIEAIGEIRVTKVEPESRVEWEADRVSGVVELKQSGWGTKVTLSLTRELPPADADAAGTTDTIAGADTIADADAIAETAAAESANVEPRATEEAAPEREFELAAVTPEPDGEGEPAAVAVAEVAPAPTGATTKQGFFARLFKRRRPAQAEPTVQSQAEPQPTPPVELHAMALPEPVYPDPPPVPEEPAVDPGAELAELEARMQQESTELLTGVLDRLGAAHHRPFSRA